jgi:lysozyme
MVKKKSVGKTRKKKSYSRKKKSSSSIWKWIFSSSGQGRKETPAWLHWLLLSLIIIAMMIIFYRYFIHPYEYRWKPCTGCQLYEICIPGKYEVHGIDISHYQNEIDWKQLRKSQYNKYPIRFIYIKATEGASMYDAAFEQNFDSARVNGFIRGAYHYFNPEGDATKQADFFISKVNLQEGDLPPVLDVERKGSNSPEELRNKVKKWLFRIQKYYGVKPILYTSYKFKARYLTDSLLNTYPYWIAHYYVDSVQYKGQWTFWQHTDVGKLPGINERVDLNVYNGRLDEFMRMTIKKKK